MVDGRPAVSQEALRRREDLIEKMALLPAVPGVLDALLDTFAGRDTDKSGDWNQQRQRADDYQMGRATPSRETQTGCGLAVCAAVSRPCRFGHSGVIVMTRTELQLISRQNKKAEPQETYSRHGGGHDPSSLPLPPETIGHDRQERHENAEGHEHRDAVGRRQRYGETDDDRAGDEARANRDQCVLHRPERLWPPV